MTERLSSQPQPTIKSYDISPRAFGVVLAIVSLVVVLGVFWDTVLHTEYHWRESAAYGHGYLVLLISVYLVWQLRARLAVCHVQMRLSGLPVLLVLSACWLAAHIVDVQVVKQLVLILMIAGLVWTLLGPDVLRALAFPLGYIVLVIPVWTQLVPMLQTNTASAAAYSLQLVGVPVFLEGFYLSIPEGKFHIAQVCAGLRYLLATMAIAALYAYLSFASLWRGVVFVALSMFLSIIFNWLRVDFIVLAGHVTDMQGVLVRSHIEFGWLMFAIGLIPVFVLGHWMSEKIPPYEGSKMEQEESVGQQKEGPLYKYTWIAGLAVAAIALSVSGPVVARLSGAVASGDARMVLEPISGTDVWAGPSSAQAELQPEFTGADAELSGRYDSGQAWVNVFAAVYANQGQGKELINDGNSLYDEDLWGVLHSQAVEVSLGAAGKRTIRETLLSSRGGERRLVWHMYIVGGAVTTNSYAAKLLQIWGLLRGRSEAGVLAFFVDSTDETSSARAVLQQFAVAMGAKLIGGLVPRDG